MNRILLKLLALLLLSLLTILLSACAASGEPDPSLPPVGGDTGLPDGDTEIYAPESGDFGRESVRFGELAYARPNVGFIVSGCAHVEKLIHDNADGETVVSEVRKLTSLFSSFESMHALAKIRTLRDTSSIEYSVEFSHTESLKQVVADTFHGLLSKLASSSYRELLEERIFGEGYLLKYATGSDAVAELLGREQELEREYGSASRAEAKKIFAELVRVRKRIAEASGYADYPSYISDKLGRDYSLGETERFMRGLANYIMPVYVSLSNTVFYSYFGDKTPTPVGHKPVINTIYDVYVECDSDLRDVYAFMLAFELYDVSTSKNNRVNTSTVAYLGNNSSPFLYMTARGDITDYMTLSRLFGEYFDSFANYGSDCPAELAVAEKALPLLTLTRLEGKLSDAEYRYLYYYEMYSLLSELVMQAYRAKFEYFVYRLPYDKITVEAIDELALEAAEAMYLPSDSLTDVFSTLTDAVVTEPQTAIADCMSIILALESYFMELLDEGRGFECFKDLTSRIIPRSFSEQLLYAGIESPLDGAFLKSVANKVHYYILGYHYFEEFSIS